MPCIHILKPFCFPFVTVLPQLRMHLRFQLVDQHKVVEGKWYMIFHFVYKPTPKKCCMHLYSLLRIQHFVEPGSTGFPGASP